MGSSPVIGEPNTSNMKILLFIGVFVAGVLADPEATADPSAEANADPWYSYYGGLGHYGYGYGLGYGYGSYYGGYRPYSYGYGYYGRKKRSAEPEPVADPSAEANADPWYTYYSGLGHYGYGHGLGYGYAGYGLGYGGYHGLGYWGRKKRSAEAEPEPTADPNADPWYRYGYYGRPYAGYGYYGHRLGYYGGRYGYGYWG